MDLLTRDDFKALIGLRAQPSISLFLPTHRSGTAIQQGPIRLKNLIRQALESPSAKHERPASLAALLGPFQDLVGDDAFWHEQADGLALFRSEGFLRTYRVPIPVPELAVVGDRFHVKPLLPLLLREGRFYVLALSQNAARLFQGSREHITEVPVTGAPKDLSEALRYDERGQELHGRQRTLRVSSSADRLYHGRGHNESDAKDQLTRYFRQIDQALAGALRNERLPLVIAGVEFELALYRSVNSFPHLMEAGIAGNPESWSAGELAAKAREIVGPYFRKERDTAREKYLELAGTGQATDDLAAVLPAAHEGRVESLFIASGVQRWGRFDEIGYTSEQHPTQQEGDEDLLDAAAAQTLLHHGRVYAVAPGDIPGSGSALAAVFRY